MEVEKLVKMFEKEKESLKNQINDKTNRLAEIKTEQENIAVRKEIIERYNEAIENLKFNKSIIKFDAYLIILFASTFIPMSITAFIAVGFAVISFLFIVKKYMIEYFENKKVIKNNKKEYEEAKENEDKDKELKISLEKDYTRIKEELLPLEYKLSWFKRMKPCKNRI